MRRECRKIEWKCHTEHKSKLTALSSVPGFRSPSGSSLDGASRPPRHSEIACVSACGSCRSRRHRCRYLCRWGRSSRYTKIIRQSSWADYSKDHTLYLICAHNLATLWWDKVSRSEIVCVSLWILPKPPYLFRWGLSSRYIKEDKTNFMKRLLKYTVDDSEYTVDDSEPSHTINVVTYTSFIHQKSAHADIRMFVPACARNYGFRADAIITHIRA